MALEGFARVLGYTKGQHLYESLETAEKISKLEILDCGKSVLGAIGFLRMEKMMAAIIQE